MPNLDGLRLGLYTRYSKLVGGDDALERQDEDGYDFAAECGGEIVRVYQEKRSAWRKKRIVLDDGTMISRVVRPDYARMLADLRAGEIEGAVVYDLDRLTRDPRDLEDAIEVAELYRRPIVGPGVDLTTDYGRANARAQAVAANKASQDTSRRVARAHRQQAQRGIPVGSTRPFGWQADKRTLEPAEADAIRDGAAKLAAGVPVPALVREWNDAGLTGSLGARWQKATLVQVFRNPRLCGLRGRWVQTPNGRGQVTSLMEVVTRRERTADGKAVEVPVVGQWEPIISVEQWQQVIAVIGDRKLAERGRNARRYLLTGICKCGLCGTGMRCNPPSGSRAAHSYHCRSGNQGGCGKVGRHGPLTEDHVLAALFHKIELETAHAVAETRPWPGEAALAEVRDGIAETRAAWTDTPRRISAKDYFPTIAELREKEDALLAERTAHLAAAGRAAARPADVRAEWDGYTLAHRRAVVSEHLLAVVVHPAGRGRKPFNPDLLELIWRD